MQYVAIKRNKYAAKKTEIDGITFHSKREASYYSDLKILKKRGEIVMFLLQVPFHLPGGIKYIADFLVFYASGIVEVVDVKGMKTAEYKLKKKLVEQFYPVTITEA